MSETTKSIPKSIAIGLVKAQAYARGVAKLGRNTVGRGYDYATAEDIIAEGRIALIGGGGIGFVVKGWNFEPLTEAGPARTKTKDGETKTLASASGRIRVRYALIHLETGDVYEDETTAPVVPEFGRPDDKAEYGALTECHAYTLRGLLNLPRGVEGAVDMNQRNDEAPVEPPAPAPANDRPRTDVPREQIRAAADAAVEAQVRGPAAHPPRTAPSNDASADDPAHVALVMDLQRLASAADADHAALYEQILATKLPKHLRDGALAHVFVAFFDSSQAADELDGWLPAVKQAALPEGSEALRLTRDAFDRAATRLGWQPAQAA